MSDNPTEQQQYELDRALLDEHGPSYIETICSFADGMRGWIAHSNASPEFAQLPMDARKAQWAAFELPEILPPTWTGFVVRPRRLTFWQSNPETASLREEYALVDGEWVLGYLPG